MSPLVSLSIAAIPVALVLWAVGRCVFAEGSPWRKPKPNRCPACNHPRVGTFCGGCGVGKDGSTPRERKLRDELAELKVGIGVFSSTNRAFAAEEILAAPMFGAGEWRSAEWRVCPPGTNPAHYTQSTGPR